MIRRRFVRRVSFANVAVAVIFYGLRGHRCSIRGARVYKGFSPFHTSSCRFHYCKCLYNVFDALLLFLSFRYIFPLAVFSRTFEKAVVFVEMARRRTPHMGAPLTYTRLYTQSHRSRFMCVQRILISSSRRVPCAVCSQRYRVLFSVYTSPA
uniref:Uncharacterized protein n=1 Tax=Rhipicephalus pulchellus TaxID=72859 RepID=L7LV70_RHIPC